MSVSQGIWGPFNIRTGKMRKSRGESFELVFFLLKVNDFKREPVSKEVQIDYVSSLKVLA